MEHTRDLVPVTLIDVISMEPVQCALIPLEVLVELWFHHIQGVGKLVELPPDLIADKVYAVV